MLWKYLNKEEHYGTKEIDHADRCRSCVEEIFIYELEVLGYDSNDIN